MKVLIVDDKEDARYLLQALLTGHGHAVSVATNGEEALEQARADLPDLIVSDILMPVMDGFRLCQEIRKDEALRDVLFVFYTATYVQESDADFAMKISADDFIRKPAEPEAFLARIEAVVERATQGTEPRKPQEMQEAEVLRLYSERLVEKLEKRSLDLQEELARREQAEEALRCHVERLEMLRTIDVAILEAKSPAEISQSVLDGLVLLLRPIRASVARFDETSKAGALLAVHDETSGALEAGDPVPVANLGDIDRLTTGAHRQVDDIRLLPEMTETEQKLLEAGIVSYVIIPLRAAGSLIGSLELGFASADAVSPECVEVSQEVANQLAIALWQTQLRLDVERHAATLERNVEELSQAKAELEKSYLSLSRALSQTVEALAAAAEVRDPYTAGHQRRVTELAVAIAGALNLDEALIEGLRVAGLMHDIGKLAVPAELLSKPSRLTETEFSLIRVHPETACDILSGVEFPWPISDIVIQHHERLDGSGYPNGLKGDEILLEARILAVADVVEAMSSHRPYRAALGIEEALAEIQDGAGTRYDARTVEACSRLFESGVFAFSEGS